ncbi:YIP1 family protein [Thermodesulfobacteriota bacterium]
MLEIICPKCNFSRNVAKDRIPMESKWATCPSCKHRFEFRLPEPDFGFGEADSAIKTGNNENRKKPPWENRFEIGIWQGIYQTFKGVLFAPEKLFRTMASGEGIREPLTFGLLMGSIGSMFGFFWQFLMLSEMLVKFSNNLFGEFTLDLFFLAIILFSPIFVIINIFFTSCIIHLMLIVVRGGKNGFEGSFRVVSYGQATQILAVVPYVGGIVGWLWLLFVQFIGLKAIHEISYLRLTMAFLIPLVFIIFLIMVMLVILFIV